MRFSKLIAALLTVSTLPTASVASLGSIGPTCPIEEESTLDVIMRKLCEKEHNGELRRLQEETIRRSTGNIKNMKPVDGITTMRARTQRFIDPTAIYTKPVTTDGDRVVVPAGMKINPLDMISPTRTLALLDGHDPEQCEVVGRLVVRDGQLKVKPIFVTESWLDLIRAWETQVFYDQKSTLSKRFDIVTVSAVIYQQGKILVFDEIPTRELQRNADL